MDQRLLMLCLLLVNCGRSGDGQESGVFKSEWGILQTLEADHRDTRTNGIELSESGGRRILSLMASDKKTRLWIMLDPTSPPFYKQVPSNLNYGISKAELENVRADGNPISSTYQAIQSHLMPEGEAEPVNGVNEGQERRN